MNDIEKENFKAEVILGKKKVMCPCKPWLTCLCNDYRNKGKCVCGVFGDKDE